jgi:hypothetical protein
MQKDDHSCGICHDVYVNVKGTIDCCEHTFCYPCISKWAQIESKCPFCRVRFSIVRKVASDGYIVSEEHVPVRDQRAVFENREFIDWLESVHCVVCNGSEAEDLLLLCDGCDQACHTYCVGLDAVPDDAWFCSQCEASRRNEVEVLPGTESPILVPRVPRGREFDTDSNCSEISEIPETDQPARRRRRIWLVDDSESDGTVDPDEVVVDLRSPEVPDVYISPPVLDLRSRLRSQLLNTTPPRLPRSVGATTVSDLTFGASVAAGRRTNTPRRSRSTFAEQAQEILRERLAADRQTVERPGQSEYAKCTDMQEDRARALQLIEARMGEKFAGITLPQEMVNFVRDKAADVLASNMVGSIDLEDEMVDDCIDEALRTFSSCGTCGIPLPSKEF